MVLWKYLWAQFQVRLAKVKDPSYTHIQCHPMMAGVEEKTFLGKIRAAFDLHPLVLNCECTYLVTLTDAPAAAGGECGSERGVAHSSTNSCHQNQTFSAFQGRLKPSSSPILFHPFSVWLWLLRHLQCWTEGHSMFSLSSMQQSLLNYPALIIQVNLVNPLWNTSSSNLFSSQMLF